MAELTEAEAAVYDRQLRVWGVEVQKRLRNARILIIGCGGLAAEVAKNIALAGVGHLELLDDTPSSQAAPSNFLNIPVHSTESVAKVMARSLSEMNPMISVSAKSVKSQEPSEEIVQGFNLVLVVGKPLGSLIPWNKLCRQKGIAFLAAVSRGTQALFFQDAGEHSFQPPDKEGKPQPVEKHNFSSLEKALQADWTSQSKIHPLIPVILCRSIAESDLLLPRIKTSSRQALFAVCATNESETKKFLGTQDTDSLLEKAKKIQDGKKAVLKQEILEEYLQQSEELAPVNAIVGGVLANEVLKCISKKGQPLDNLFCYSMLDGSGVIEKLRPPV